MSYRVTPSHHATNASDKQNRSMPRIYPVVWKCHRIERNGCESPDLPLFYYPFVADCVHTTVVDCQTRNLCRPPEARRSAGGAVLAECRGPGERKTFGAKFGRGWCCRRGRNSRVEIQVVRYISNCLLKGMRATLAVLTFVKYII